MCRTAKLSEWFDQKHLAYKQGNEQTTKQKSQLSAHHHETYLAPVKQIVFKSLCLKMKKNPAITVLYTFPIIYFHNKCVCYDSTYISVVIVIFTKCEGVFGKRTGEKNRISVPAINLIFHCIGQLCHKYFFRSSSE